MKLSRPWAWLLVVSGAVWLPPIAGAEDWQAVGFVSSTVGVSTSRVCVGAPSANRPSDFGCPTNAPYIDPVTGYVGVGTSAPSSNLEIASDSAAAAYVSQYSTDVVGPAILLRKARGTTAAPSFVASSDAVGQIDFAGYGTVGGFGTGARILVRADPGGNGVWSSTGRSSQLLFYTVPTNSTTLTERLKIGSDGVFSFNGGTFSITAAGSITPGASIYMGSGNGIGYSSGATDIYIPQDGGLSGSLINSRSNVRVNIDSDNNSGTGKFIVGNNQTTNTSGNELFLVTEGGNVGIGTTNPSNTLHVSGTARITSWTAIAANVTPTTALDVYGTISATNLVVNGVEIGGQADRIVSGTASVIANSSTGVSISVPLEVSGSIRFAGVDVETCSDGSPIGTLRFDAATGAVEMCRQ